MKITEIYNLKFILKPSLILSPLQVTAQLVLASLPSLPPAMPPHFVSAYTPIAAAGTPAQKRHVSRLLAAQLSGAGLKFGPDGVPVVAPLPVRLSSCFTVHIIFSILKKSRIS